MARLESFAGHKWLTPEVIFKCKVTPRNQTEFVETN